MRFSVWAPAAERVDLVLDDEKFGMDAGERGWFSTDVEAAAGTDYRFSLDGSDPLPDPRSPWQPQGIDGPSRTLDHLAFEWNDGGWTAPPLEEWVIYELHIGTFTPEGTLDSAIDKLPYLVDLGINAIELLPVNTFSGDRGWGYDGVDLYAPHPAYGGPNALKRFVDAAHAQGFAVILDVVYNHLGPAGNYLGRFGPYFTDKYSTPWGDALNFDDADSDEVRRFFADNALMWLRDYHFDALRLDAVHAILDTSATHILEEISEDVEALAERLARPLYLIAESDLNDPRMVRARTSSGLGMDAQWSDDFHHALHALVTGERSGYYSDFGSVEHLRLALDRAFVYAGDYSEHRRRRHGRHPGDLWGRRFLAYIQNHDQIGNRARGERLTHLVGFDLAKVAAAITLTSPFVPMLFQGEEWGSSSPFQYFTAHEDPELGRAVSEGRKREFSSFGWDPKDVPDPQDRRTFERSKLAWDEKDEGEHAGMLSFYRALIALRHAHPGLATGKLHEAQLQEGSTDGSFAVTRGEYTIECNIGSEIAPPATDAARRGELLLASHDGAQDKLAPHSVTIWRALR